MKRVLVVTDPVVTAAMGLVPINPAIEVSKLLRLRYPSALTVTGVDGEIGEPGLKPGDPPFSSRTSADLAVPVPSPITRFPDTVAPDTPMACRYSSPAFTRVTPLLEFPPWPWNST